MGLKPYFQIAGTVFAMVIGLLIVRSMLHLEAYPSLSLAPPGDGGWIGRSPSGVDLFSLLADASIRGVWSAVWAAFLTLCIGSLVGIITAERPSGWCDRSQSALGNILDSIGSFVIAACVLAVADRLSHLALGSVVALASWPPAAVVIRNEITRTKSMAYYEAALSLGLGPATLFVRHVLPNVLDRVVPFGLALVTAFLGLFGALDFIGAGQASAPQLGSLIYESLSYIESAPWFFISSVSAFAIVLLVLGLSSQLLHRILKGPCEQS